MSSHSASDEDLQALKPSVHRWRAVAYVLVAFFGNMQPSEAYLSTWIVTTRGVSHDDLNSLVYPVDTYASVVFALLCVAAVSRWGCWRVALLGQAARLGVRALLLWSSGVPAMCAAQALYALAVAVERAALFTLPFSASADGFGGVLARARIATAARAAHHVGALLAALLADVLVTRVLVEMRVLFAISAGTAVTAALVLLALVPRDAPPAASSSSSSSQLSPSLLCTETRTSSLRALFALDSVRLCGTWWLLGGAAHAIAGNYFQSQFVALAPDHGKHAHFGSVAAAREALAALASAAAPLARRGGAGALGTFAVAGGALLVLAGSTSSLVVAFVAVVGAWALFGAQTALAALLVASPVAIAALEFGSLLVASLTQAVTGALTSSAAVFLVVCGGLHAAAAPLMLAVALALAARRRTLVSSKQSKQRRLLAHIDDDDGNSQVPPSILA